ncbi:hypothetical protein CKCBHOJB_03210 [Thauera sp. GDN1]|uniref:PIN domain-containing protein n=1 Tax=Thauera sp. GDN1 TaxID=2944810 RepID=UPI0024788AA3|nr:PIN domain-containing protein [Thauera sp. GDN1]WEN43585.1 hypothetical protein CKCBHOJB_03210 [Thauera sp. GDN1]
MSEIFTPVSGTQIYDQRPALVLDTNTVLALWMFRDPALEKLRDWIEAGNCRLYSREDALEELRRVLAYRQFGLDLPCQEAIHCHYRSLLTPWAGPRGPSATDESACLPRCSDTDDQKFLEIAFEAEATHLLTRDKALLKLQRPVASRMRCSIMQPDSFKNGFHRHQNA